MSKLTFDDLMALSIGDKVYEYCYGVELESTVIRVPFTEGDGMYAKLLCKGKDGAVIEYGINKDYQHYGPNIYNYRAYATLD